MHVFSYAAGYENGIQNPVHLMGCINNTEPELIGSSCYGNSEGAEGYMQDNRVYSDFRVTCSAQVVSYTLVEGHIAYLKEGADQEMVEM